MSTYLPDSIRVACQHHLQAEIHSVEQISGGDINQARLLHTATGRFFLKINKASFANELFLAEIHGLQALHESGCLRTPKTIAHGQTKAGSFLLMEYIEPGKKGSGFWEKFGSALASLHRKSARCFGFYEGNFIGSLIQSNSLHASWPAFYTEERLLPQLEMARQSGLLNKKDETAMQNLFKALPSIFPQEPPALIHGDLWSGNFLQDNNSEPVLIDPSVSYSHREMDLAMSRLFGGFDRDFYRSYEACFPLSPGFEKRLSVYQLYYLLAHVNMFGGSYVQAVREILLPFSD